MNQQPKNHRDLSPEPGNSAVSHPAGRSLAAWSPPASLATAAFVVVCFLFVLLPGSPAGAQEVSGSGSFAGQQAVEEALKYEGVPFVLGGPADCVPGWQMDCTCLTTTVFRAFGIELPDLPTSLPYYGVPVYGPPQAGDVHVWGDPGDGTGGHVAIDMGDGNIVHANAVTMSTSVAPMYYGDPYYLGAWRLVY